MDVDAKPLSAEDTSSFAYKTVKDRIPEIITKIIDRLHRNGVELPDHTVDRESAKVVIHHLSKLRYEVMTDKPLFPLDPDHTSDHETWNMYLKRYQDERGRDPSWFTAPWLYWECFMYRYFQTIVSIAGIPEFDMFQSSKRKQLTDSSAAMQSLATFMEGSVPVESPPLDIKEALFHQFLQICLWGNECDLSISGMAENAQSRDPLTSLPSLMERIVVNDAALVWSHISTSSSTSPLVIVLDNAGFELFADLCFADFLLRVGLVPSVIFFGKTVPWFVSDVTKSDFWWTIDQVSTSGGLLGALGGRWAKLLEQRKFVYEDHPFFTSPFDYAAMKEEAPDLHKRLSAAKLVVFKGDLNYRKLVGDRSWPYTTDFRRALRGFHPAPFLSLRLCKADVVVGLQPGQNEKLMEQQEDWMCVGKYAVIQSNFDA